MLFTPCGFYSGRVSKYIAHDVSILPMCTIWHHRVRDEVASLQFGFAYIDPNSNFQLKTEIAETMKYTVDDMLKELEEHKDQDKKMIDSILRSPAKAKRKELKRERNLILKTTYPILSLGLRWTNHIETIDEQSDVLMVTIDPLYLPWTKENAVSLAIGK